MKSINFERLLKVASAPFRMLYASLDPVSYAKWIGVQCKGAVKIYGSSYGMFSTEPFLVTLGDNVYISVGARFICHDGSTLPLRQTIPDLELAGPISVGSNVFVGTGALILPNVTIGDDCVIGANAVVTKDVESGMIVAGNPARVVSTMKEFIEKAKRNSLKIGHLSGRKKEQEYKRIFGIE